MVNSLAFCAQAILVETQRLADATTVAPSQAADTAPFPEAEIRTYLERNLASILATQVADFQAVAESLTRLTENLPADLETLEQQLTALEQKLIALARIRQTDEQALTARKELDNYLRPYRGKMSAPQLAMLEAQFLDRAVLETFRLPRLSLFHLR